MTSPHTDVRYCLGGKDARRAAAPEPGTTRLVPGASYKSSPDAPYRSSLDSDRPSVSLTGRSVEISYVPLMAG